MLVDKYDVNEDGAISDTELLSQVSVSPLALCCGRVGAGLEAWATDSSGGLSSCTALADRMCVAAYVCRCVCPVAQLEHLCSHEITHVTSRTWSQPSRVRYQSQYPPELPMHVPRPESPEQRRVRVSEAPSSRERAMSPEVVRTVVISAVAQPKRDRSRSRSRCAECHRAMSSGTASREPRHCRVVTVSHLVVNASGSGVLSLLLLLLLLLL